MEWRDILYIEDEQVIKLLGSHKLAFRDRGVMSETNEYQIYVLVAGNGVIIQIHNCTYVVVIVKRKIPNRFLKYDYKSREEEQAVLYALQETLNSLSEEKWIQNMKKRAEKDFD